MSWCLLTGFVGPSLRVLRFRFAVVVERERTTRVWGCCLVWFRCLLCIRCCSVVTCASSHPPLSSLSTVPPPRPFGAVTFPQNVCRLLNFGSRRIDPRNPELLSGPRAVHVVESYAGAIVENSPVQAAMSPDGLYVFRGCTRTRACIVNVWAAAHRSLHRRAVCCM